MTVSLEMISIKDFLPPNGTSVIVQMLDSVSKETKMATGYFYNGVFWDSPSSKAQGLEESAKQGDIKLYNWRVTY